MKNTTALLSLPLVSLLAGLAACGAYNDGSVPKKDVPAETEPVSEPEPVPRAAPVDEVIDYGPPPEMSATSVPGLAFDVPADWIVETPSGSMRAAQFRFGTRGAMVVFSSIGGGVEANIERWIGQVSLPDGSPSAGTARRGTRQVGDLTVHTLDVTGTWSGSMGSNDGGANTRFLGAVIEVGGQPFFFRTTGDADEVAEQMAGYQAFLESVRLPGAD